MRAHPPRLLPVLAGAAALVVLAASPASAYTGTVTVDITGSSYALVDVHTAWSAGAELNARVLRDTEGVVLTLMTCDFAGRSRAGSRVSVPRDSTGTFVLTLDTEASAAAREVARERCATIEIENRATLRTAKVRLALSS